MCALPTSVGGVPGAIISRTDRATAAVGEAGTASMGRVQRQLKGARWLGAPHLGEAAAEGLAAAVVVTIGAYNRS
jgi:hypothetical protein